jgi:hypothetical protein
MPIQLKETKMERQFEAGTEIRCNRCNAKGKVTRTFHAVRENSKAWRITCAEDMMIHPTCGHMDGHWVFDDDN